MGANRIKIAKDKADLVKVLTASDDTTGVFQTYVEVMVFAAGLGAKRKKRVPLAGVSKDLEPIRLEYFENHKYDLVINLLAVSEVKEHNILADDEKLEEQRIKIFEEYANAGLEILQQELRGAVDYSEQILLLLSSERFQQEQSEEEFDLSKFLSK